MLALTRACGRAARALSASEVIIATLDESVVEVEAVVPEIVLRAACLEFGLAAGAGEAEPIARQRHAPASKPNSKQRAGLLQALAHGTGRPAKRLSRFEVSLAFQVAEHQRRPVLLRQVQQLLIQERAQLIDRLFRMNFGLRHGSEPPFVRMPPGRAGAGLLRQAIRHAEQPAPKRRLLANRGCLASQHQEYGLEDVLGVLVVAEHAPANGQHQRPVPAHQRLKHPLSVESREPLKQFPIAQIAKLSCGPGHPPDVLQDWIQLDIRHCMDLGVVVGSLYSAR